MIESLLLNPGGDLDERLDNPGRRRRRRKNKSVRRTKRRARGRGRRKNRGNFGRRMAALRRAKRGGSRRHRNSWKGSSRRHAKAARKGWRRKSSGRRRRNTGRRYSISRSRRFSRSRRRRNPRGVVLGGSGGMGELWTGPFKIVNFKEPTGILSGVVSASIVGITAASSMVATNIIVNGVDPLLSNLSSTTRAWIKPWLYTAMSGVMGFAAKKFGQAFFRGDSRKINILTIAAAVPPALQAVGALLKAALPNADWGPFQPIYNAATGLSGDDDDGMDDYLQVEGSGGGDGSASGMEDYLQMGEMHEAGMGEMYEAGMGYNYDQEEVESAAAPF